MVICAINFLGLICHFSDPEAVSRVGGCPGRILEQRSEVHYSDKSFVTLIYFKSLVQDLICSRTMSGQGSDQPFPGNLDITRGGRVYNIWFNFLDFFLLVYLIVPFSVTFFRFFSLRKVHLIIFSLLRIFLCL